MGLLFSLPAKRLLNAIFKMETNRYFNPWRLEIFVDFALFICILMMVSALAIDKTRMPKFFIDNGITVG